MQDTLIDGEVGVEHRFGSINVSLVSLGDIAHHHGEHRPFRVEYIVEMQLCDRLVKIVAFLCLHLEPLLF